VSVASIAVFSRDKRTGALTQLAGPQGCLSDDGTNGNCTRATALRGATAVTVSNDGKHVYVASYQSGAVAAFARNKDTGALTQLAGQGACVSEDGTGGLCANGHALSGPQAVVVSKDGKRVYVATYRSESVVTLIRDRTTGALTQPTGTEWCISDDGTGGLCTDGVALSGATTMALSPNGRTLYVTSPATNAVAVLMRERRIGTLSQAPAPYGCVSDDGSGGACTDGDALRNVYGVAVAPDSRSFYVAGRDHNALTVIGRDEETGALTQAPPPWGCISEDGYEGLCTDGRVLRSPRTVAVSADGKHVYVAAQSSNGVAVLQREK
jgi:DNA-binding beta-propeller fold protein YncE